MQNLDLTYAQFISLKSTKNLPIQFSESSDRYYVFLVEGPLVWETTILKGSSDATDFENNYKNTANGKLIPIIQTTPFSANQVVFNGAGVFATIQAGQTVDVDLKINSNSLLNGGILQTSGEEMGDYFSAQVVDKDNIFGYGAGAVLNTWISKWYVLSEDVHMDLTTPQAGSIPAGLYLRIKYTSTGTSDVKIIVNYKLNTAL